MLNAYAIIVPAKKDMSNVSNRHKRKPQSLTSGVFSRLVVTVASV